MKKSRSVIGSANKTYDFDIEQVQIRMLESIEHFEENRLREFQAFLCNFHEFLTTPRLVFGVMKTPGFDASKKWLLIMQRHIELTGFPESLANNLRMSVRNRDMQLLAWVIRKTIEVFRITLNKEVKHGN